MIIRAIEYSVSLNETTSKHVDESILAIPKPKRFSFYTLIILTVQYPDIDRRGENNAVVKMVTLATYYPPNCS